MSRARAAFASGDTSGFADHFSCHRTRGTVAAEELLARSRYTKDPKTGERTMLKPPKKPEVQS